MTPDSPDFVVDASVGVKLLLAEPLSDRAQAVFDLLGTPSPGQLFVPDLFYLECANTLWKHVRKGTLTAGDAIGRIRQLRSLRLRVAASPDLTEDALRLAVEQDITAYDACYVVLADREGVPLVSDDQILIRKLTGTSHRILWLGDFT